MSTNKFNSTVNNAKFDLQKVVISPNPSKSIFRIDFNNSLTTTATIEIFSIDGRKIKEFTIDKDTKNDMFNIENEVSGTFLVTIIVGDDKINKIIIKQ